MNAEAHLHQMPELIVLLRAGGAYGGLLLVMGLFLTLWGLIDLFFVRVRLVLTLHALLSFVPAILALWGIHTTYVRFAQMAMSTVAPKPTELASVTSFAMACGFWGILATAIPAILGVLALSKSTEQSRQSHTPNT